jgi:hypothetical protein
LTERIVEVLIPIMIPLQTGAQPTPPSLGGGPEDVFTFLYWLMQKPVGKRPTKRKLPLSRKAKRLMRLLKSLDALRTLQLARDTAVPS